MSPTIKNILKFIFFLALGAGLIYLIFHGLSAEDIQNVKQAITKANYIWVGVALVVSLLSHWLRAVRWKMMIEPVGEPPSTANAFFAITIGYMTNYAPLPRLGEVYRPLILSRYDKTPFTTLMGTVIVERIIDTLILIILFFLMLIFSFNKVFLFIKMGLKHYVSDKLAHLEHMNALLIAIAIMFLGVAIFIYRKKKNAIVAFFGKYIKNFEEGLKSVGKLKKPILFWFYTIAIWLCYLLGTYFCFFCFEESSHLTISDGIIVLIFGTFGVIITPGGTGAFQIIVTKVLTRICMLSFSIAFTISWIIWGSQLVLIVFLGLISLIMLPIVNKNEEVRGNTSQSS